MTHFGLRPIKQTEKEPLSSKKAALIFAYFLYHQGARGWDGPKPEKETLKLMKESTRNRI